MRRSITRDRSPKTPHVLSAVCCLATSVMLSSSTALAQQGAEGVQPNRCPTGLITPEVHDDLLELTLLGVACFERGEFGYALMFYRRAYEISKVPPLEAAIGRSLHELGLYSSAQLYYDLYLEHERADGEGRARIEERLERLERQLQDAATITLRAFPGQALVRIETHEGHKETIGVTPLTIALEPRRYHVVLEQERFSPKRFTIDPAPGEHETYEQEMVPQRATFDLSTRAMRRVGAITSLVGAPLLLGGATLRLLDPPSLGREPQALMLVGATTVALGVGILGIGYWRERRLREAGVTLTLGAELTPASASFTLRW